ASGGGGSRTASQGQRRPAVLEGLALEPRDSDSACRGKAASLFGPSEREPGGGPLRGGRRTPARRAADGGGRTVRPTRARPAGAEGPGNSRGSSSFHDTHRAPDRANRVCRSD